MYVASPHRLANVSLCRGFSTALAIKIAWKYNILEEWIAFANAITQVFTFSAKQWLVSDYARIWLTDQICCSTIGNAKWDKSPASKSTEGKKPNLSSEPHALSNRKKYFSFIVCDNCANKRELHPLHYSEYGCVYRIEQNAPMITHNWFWVRLLIPLYSIFVNTIFDPWGNLYEELIHKWKINNNNTIFNNFFYFISISNVEVSYLLQENVKRNACCTQITEERKKSQSSSSLQMKNSSFRIWKSIYGSHGRNKY